MGRKNSMKQIMLQRRKIGIHQKEEKKHQEESKELMKKVRETPDGKKRQHEVDNASKKKLGIHLKEGTNIKQKVKN